LVVPLLVLLHLQFSTQQTELYASVVACPLQSQTQQIKMRKPRTSVHGALTPTDYYPGGGDDFKELEENGVKLTSEEPVSTFSADVDTASYSYVRRMLNKGQLPPHDAVRIEEMVNYFDYEYPLPAAKEEPFQQSVLVSTSPWTKGQKLLHIGIKGYDVYEQPESRRQSNLVFLIDVYGSMESRLDLLKESMELLLTALDPKDHVAIVAYSHTAQVQLPPAPVAQKKEILRVLRSLRAGGGTAGSDGLKLAYDVAPVHFAKTAVNRIILASDRDFNMGSTEEAGLKQLVQEKRKLGIFLTVLGFGFGNYRDARLQTLANNGNDVAAYIDTVNEAQKFLADEAQSALFPIAKDVKMQVEFNLTMVSDYRLVGYEKRLLNREDFNNDKVDAGDMGSGHTVTVIYEITPTDAKVAAQVDDLRYTDTATDQKTTDPSDRVNQTTQDEYCFLKIRYKLPDEETSRLMTTPIGLKDEVADQLNGKLQEQEPLYREFGFATAVASFSQILKGGKYTGDFDYGKWLDLATETEGTDPFGYRAEFIELVRKAKLASQQHSSAY
jgi:Ca-activated chloride channel family protein